MRRPFEVAKSKPNLFYKYKGQVVQSYHSGLYDSTNKTMVTATNDTEALAEQLSNLRTNTAPPPGSSLAFKYNLFADGDPRHPRPIPRYLFRVYSSHSAGTTSDSIIHSKAACSDNERIRESSKTCIFRKEQRELASEMVFKHLRWKPHNDGDNLISWTSSILFAIVYIFYHRTHYGAPKEDIHLCVIDTKKFKDKTFICDRDLIDVLKKDTADWNTLVNWRSTRLYFGEYLSQGSMGVKGKCVVVSAAQLFNEGLLDTHDDFRRLKEQMEQETKAETETKGKPKTKWALKVCNFRDAWPQNAVKLEQTRGEAIVRVADLFGERWRLPVALSLASLHPYVNTAYILTSEFQRGSRIGCLTSK